MLREMPLAALLPIRDACPLYYPQKSAEPAPTKRLRAFLAAFSAPRQLSMPATARVAALFMHALLIATSSHAISALLGVSSLMQVDQWRVSGLSLSVRYSTRPPRSPGLHPHGEPTPCSSHTAAAAVAGHPPASPAVAGGSRAATATGQTQQGVPLCWASG